MKTLFKKTDAFFFKKYIKLKSDKKVHTFQEIISHKGNDICPRMFASIVATYVKYRLSFSILIN